MKKQLEKPDSALLSLALSISEKTAAVATIKYGNVVLSNEDIEVAMFFESEHDEFQVLYVDQKGDERPYWKFFIPFVKLGEIKKIESTIILLLGVSKSDLKIKPILSLPAKYVSALFQMGEIYLDRYFVINGSKKCTNYSIIWENGRAFLKFIVDEKHSLTKEINVFPRSGNGNEDL